MTSGEDRWTLIERAEMNVDHAALKRRKREQAKLATDQRIAQLRHMFRDSVRSASNLEINTEAAANKLLIAAIECHDQFRVLAIVQVAIDHRWSGVVATAIRYFGQPPLAVLLQLGNQQRLADSIQELWNLTADRPAV